MNAELFPRFPHVARCENSKSLLHIVHTSDLKILFLCMIFTLIGARVSAKFANKASAKVLNRTLGVVLTVIGGLMIIMDLLK